jgi:hypothetical protein
MVDPHTKHHLKNMGIPPISKITDRIYLGSIEGTDPSILKKYGITHIINAAKDATYTTTLPRVNLRLDDVPQENLFRVLEPSKITIRRILEKSDNRVLIHCMAGVSRSASVLIYFLMKERGLGYDQALDFLRQSRPIVNPNEGFEKTLREVEKIR